MPAVPTFVLRKLYIPGSLQNTADGFELKLKNTLASGTVIGLGPLVIDGTPCATTDVYVTRGETTRCAADITKGAPVPFDINQVVTIMVRGTRLTPGLHTVILDVMTKEAGRLIWDIRDTVLA